LVLKGAKQIDFASMDDITEIPDDVGIVVCGGGDIINDYFMRKAQRILVNFVGRIYAVSVGIPYSSGVKYLHMFDHVFVRSQADYNLSCEELGTKNVTVIPDATSAIVVRKKLSSNYNKKRVGLCLAQPMFYNNPKKSVLIKAIISAIMKLHEEHKDTEFHMFAFNYGTNTAEGDDVINTQVAKRLIQYGINAVIHNEIKSTEAMLEYFSRYIDVNICMRYHSVMFSLMTGTPFVALYSSQKIDNLLADVSYDPDCIYRLETDNSYRPTKIDEDKLLQCLRILISKTMPSYAFNVDSLNQISNTIFSQQKTADILLNYHIRSFDDVLSSCRRNISKYLHIDVASFDVLLYKHQPFPLNGKSVLEVARYICFLISGKIHHPCLWGLVENLVKDDFCLFAAIDYIWKYTKQSDEVDGSLDVYYPRPVPFQRRVLINLDFVFQNDFSQYHRSGWGYVVGGLMNLDAPTMLKGSDILLDTYLDRSFHWGLDILKTIGVIPYTKPWYGFVHHTFDTTHSEYNCIELFKNQYFLESLKCCKGLLALSNHLAEGLRTALREMSVNVPVYVLYHPMEFVSNMFTMEKFLKNPRRRLVQIGAWLRNPYALYELPLPSDGGPLRLQKTALKGKEMEQYFRPPNFFEVLEDTLIRKDWYHDNSEDDVNINSISRRHICRPFCRPSCHRNNVNKYCQGLYDSIMRQNNSVEVLDRLDNSAYDNLLSENIVFLNLVDCSAVNTVVECIVRNSVLIVNRLPALEEILGNDYPGFYDTLLQASEMCQDIATINRIHTYMTYLDKERYKLEFFMNHIQDILSSEGEEWNYEYDLFNVPSKNKNIFQLKYGGILRFLPFKFSRILL
jgi:hypothetical protein